MARAALLPRRVCLFLALGAVLTLLTAWPIPLALLRFGRTTHTLSAPRPWTAPSGIACSVKVSRLTFSDWFQVRPLQPRDSHLSLGEPAVLPSFIAAPTTRNPLPDNIDTGTGGWPFRALASESWLYQLPADSPTGRWREDLRWCTVLLSTSRGRIILPYRPIWPGLIADVAIYAGVLLGLALTWRTVLGALRRRHGCCPRCGYDLRATPAQYPCPECGAPADTLPTCPAGSDSSPSASPSA